MADPRPRLLPLFAAVCFLILPGGPARADIVKLKNGNTMEGKVLEEGEEGVVLRTVSGGTMTFRRDAVESIERRDDLEEATPAEEEPSARKPAPKNPARGGAVKKPAPKPPAKKPPPKKAQPPMKKG